MNTAVLMRELAATVDAPVLDGAAVAPYLLDATEARGLRGRADAVVLAKTANDVAGVLAWCYEHDVPLTPRGGGTGYAGGAVPDGGLALVAAADGTTNALGLPRPEVFAPLYGKESAGRFRAHAAALGIELEDLALANLVDDVDTLNDLERVGGDLRHLLEHLAHLGARHALSLDEVVELRAVVVVGQGRVQLVAAPLHLDLVAVGERGERLLETTLADVAPRAGDVRPDLDLHARLNDGDWGLLPGLSRAGPRRPGPRGVGAGPAPWA